MLAAARRLPLGPLFPGAGVQFQEGSLPGFPRWTQSKEPSKAMSTTPANPVQIGIVTASDRASAGTYEDRSGPAIVEYLQRVLLTPWKPLRRIIPDELQLLKQTLVELCDQHRCALVVTTGGTGPAPRDITPEATEAVCEKLLPGFGELMRKVSLEKVPTAILSRQTAGVRGSTLIVNLPGQPRAIAECLDAVFPAIPYCIELIGGPTLQTNPQHLVAYRPPKK